MKFLINVLLIFIPAIVIFVGYKYFYQNSNSCDSEVVLRSVAKIRQNSSNYSYIEKTIDGIATEGADAKYYRDKSGQLVLVDLVSIVSLAKFNTSYYIKDGKVIYINSLTEEFDPIKLYGKSGDLSYGQGEFVVATSTREGYVVNDDKLCEYISEKPRQASISVTASNSEKDFTNLLRIFKIKLNN